MRDKLPLNRTELRKQDVDFRIGSIISDGMWYTLTKWRNNAKVTEEELLDWVDEHLKDGSLIQSPASVGSKSYRMPLWAIEKWYDDHGIELGTQLLEFIFPPRIWDGMTEVEGLNSAPLREIGMVTFSCSLDTYKIVKEKLLGIARIREETPGLYKAYCLSSSYVKDIVQEVFEEQGEVGNVLRARSKSNRREMVDLTEEFAKGLVMFYKKFGKTLVRGHQETINIYLPDPFDQESQMIVWVIHAIEKFNESVAVPFSGYFNNVMGRWPYDLPVMHLGPELSTFQREKSRAIKRLTGDSKDTTINFSNQEVADEMGWDIEKYNKLEARHNIWMKTRNATTLTWEESAEERMAVSSVTGGSQSLEEGASKDIDLANKLSLSVLRAGVKTGRYRDALNVISQLDVNDIDFKKLTSLNESFVKQLGELLDYE